MLVTKQFIKDLRTANSIVTRFNGDNSSIDLFYHYEDRRNDRVTTYQYKHSDNLIGVWHIGLYPDMKTVPGDTLNLIKSGDNIQFDCQYNGNQYTANAGLVVTDLYLTIKVYKPDGVTLRKTNTYLLDSQICPNNSALNIPMMADKMNHYMKLYA